MRIKKDLKWALVLSGGGARGIAHVGVLNALSEMGLPAPSLVVGTSMGAIIGGLYACGMSPPEMIRFIRDEFDITEYLDGFAFKVQGAMGKVFQTGQILGSVATRAGIDTGHQLLKLLEDLTGGKAFDETRIPFRCNATDLVSGREIIFSTGSVARAIRASMSFPGFFEPLLDGDYCLADGGLCDNLPVSIARAEGFKRVLAVDVNLFQASPLSDLKTFSKIVYRSIEVMLNVIDKKGPRAALTIHAANGATPFDFSRKLELVNLGEQAVRGSEKAIAAFFSGGPVAYATRQRNRECGISGHASSGV
ncbi:patatin family protein [Treponema primitia ZAS-2]|uniref:Patatin family protein n=1 Tax=Treponema primitia (strain ATCC BAA-887 / DSM 12427 / ZAS-2) TaxID=545694 RepID=F5YR20_TREPZ|nr:patatin-like phospholipase family protein [Treponema primitia]AEF84392.1 patatin family protein [Treponema primitia ZAS-2]